MTLTEEQLLATTRTGQDVCVIAGPGSGKTRVLVERFRWLVETGVEPSRILAITFTEKAANELKKRLSAYFADDTQQRTKIERSPVSTVHGFCTRILKENALAAELDPEFEVLDEREADLLLRQAIDDALNALLKTDPAKLRKLYQSWAAGRPVDAFARAYDAVRLAGDGWPPLASNTETTAFADLQKAILGEKSKGELLSILEWSRDPRNIPPSMPPKVRAPATREALKTAKAAWATVRFTEERATLDFLLRDIDLRYSDLKRTRSRVDFNDLEAFSIRLLEQNETIRLATRNRYDAILMDEVQDTNPLQWRLVELIRRGGRFFAVGDINQAIYGFRHARPDAFRELRQVVLESGGAIDQLRQNFRSREEILAAAEEIVGNEPGVEKPGLIPGRVFSSPADRPVERLIAEHDDPIERVRQEAKTIANRILELVGLFEVETRNSTRAAQFGDIALLFRTSLRYKEYEEALLEAGIPYLITGGRTFFERQEIADLVSYLRVLSNPRDEIALSAILRSPFVGFDDEALLRLREPGESLIDSLRRSNDSRVVLFLASLDEARLLADDLSPDRLLTDAMDCADYEGKLDAAATANIRKFLTLIRERFTSQPQTLAGLIDHLDRLRDAAEEQNAPVTASTNAVQIMSIHAAKGLEFPIVFLPSLDADARRDSGGGLIYSRETGLGAKWRTDAGDEFLDSTSLQYADLIGQREKEEGNRLLYVAMTRAEQKLVLSSAGSKRGWTKLIAGVPLNELPAPVANAQAQSEESGTSTHIVDRPVLTGQHDDSVAVTDVALFAHCPRRYFLDRYLGWTKSNPRSFDEDADIVDHGELSASEFGTEVHRLLAGAPRTDASSDALRLLSTFESSELGQRAAKAAHAARERRFVMAVEDVTLHGQIDLWFEDAGDLILVDYKTDASPDDRSDAYSVQIDLYADALEKITGRRPDRAIVCFLTPGRQLEVKMQGQGRNALRQLKAAQANQEFPLNEGSHCTRCPQYQGACPSRAGESQLTLFQ